MNILLESTTQQSTEQIGYLIGVIFGVTILLAIPVSFIFSLVRFIKTNNKGWLVGVVLGGIPLLFILGLFLFGLTKEFLAVNDLVDVDGNIAAPKNQVIELVEGRVSGKIPSHWKLLKDLNELAIFQAGSQIREEYIIILRLSKEDFDGSLLEYAEFSNKNIVDFLISPTVKYTEEKVINGLEAVSSRVDGKFENLNICYLNTVIESDTDFYQILGWTLRSKQNSALPVIEEFKNSISLVNKSLENL